MNKSVIMAAAIAFACCLPSVAQNKVNIGKNNNIDLRSGLLTPEGLWAMGRIASYSPSPDGKQVVYPSLICIFPKARLPMLVNPSGSLSTRSPA